MEVVRQNPLAHLKVMRGGGEKPCALEFAVSEFNFNPNILAFRAVALGRTGGKIPSERRATRGIIYAAHHEPVIFGIRDSIIWAERIGPFETLVMFEAGGSFHASQLSSIMNAIERSGQQFSVSVAFPYYPATGAREESVLLRIPSSLGIFSVNGSC